MLRASILPPQLVVSSCLFYPHSPLIALAERRGIYSASCVSRMTRYAGFGMGFGTREFEGEERMDEGILGLCARPASL